MTNSKGGPLTIQSPVTRQRPFTSPLTDFVRLELIKNLQKRLELALQKDLTSAQRLQLEASMSYCENMDSPVNFQLDIDGTNKEYSGWNKVIQKFMDHTHGGHKM
jgi:hypothetical protein